MAGGTWTKQDKVRPGVYINFTSESQRGLSIGSRAFALAKYCLFQ